MTVDAQGIHIGWDDTWECEYPFQALAVYAAKKFAGQSTHLLDTSKLSTPDNYNRSVAGAPDIVASVDGRYIEIELKTAHGKQTKPQEREGERVENSGAQYVVARTLREVFEVLAIEVPDA